MDGLRGIFAPTYSIPFHTRPSPLFDTAHGESSDGLAHGQVCSDLYLSRKNLVKPELRHTKPLHCFLLLSHGC